MPATLLAVLPKTAITALPHAGTTTDSLAKASRSPLIPT
jgi:hypothetical protein